MFHALETLIQDQFLPERELKAGERGTVSLLREKDTGKRVVCHRFSGSGEVYEALQAVECSNLPRVEQVARQDGQVLVLEEYIQGDTLAFLLEDRPLPETQAREILLQVCRALKVLHSLGVVHRDVKPENIILRGDEAVLIDFDVSRVCKPEQKTDTQVMGTTGYAAPEQFGFSQTDARADIFALGVLLNEMLTRRHPSHELADGDLRPIIEKCIEVNVNKRYASVDELMDALRVPRTKKRRRPLILSAVLLVAVAVTMVLLWPNMVRWTAGTFEPETPNNTEQLPPQESEVPTYPDQISPQESEDPDNTTEIPEISLQQNKILWHGDPEVYGTQFRYDLDRDGKSEEYVFAAMFDFVGEPLLLQHSGSTINDKPEVMEVVGAVWAETEEGFYVPVENFAPLLTDCTVSLRQIEGEHDGVVEQIGSLYGIWPGAIRATFEYVGRWYYECSAVLNGETLTAVGATRTGLQSEAAESVEPYMAPFQYDLDGDGAAEEYWFGAISQIENGAVPFFHDGTGFYKGSSSKRIVAPAVWRQISRDKYEQVQEFAAILERPQVNLHCVNGNVQPKVSAVEGLFGVWSGAVEVIFTHDGLWVYECSAMLDGLELTAAAVTQVETRPPGT